MRKSTSGQQDYGQIQTNQTHRNIGTVEFDSNDESQNESQNIGFALLGRKL